MLMEDSDYIEFQSTLPRRERLLIALIYLVLPYFNPRSHEGSDDTDGHFVLGVTGFQSTLPRRERQWATFGFNGSTKISIHAPTKGATKNTERDTAYCEISIHAPTKGATSLLVSQVLSYHNFNPRSHEGSDTPARWLLQRDLHFNPRSHEGSDVLAR